MAYSLGYSPDASDEWNDPYCDLCFEVDSLNVKAVSFCDDCVQFMCNKCYMIHEKLNATRRHVVKTGKAMPRSQADKPPRYGKCDDHPKHLNDQFCSVHKQLICSLCSPLYHKNCSTGSVEDVSKSISASETNDLYDIVSDMKRDLESSLTAVKSNINDLKDQKRSMRKQAKELYDEMVSKAQKWFDDEKSEIDTHCKLQISVLKQNRTIIINAVTRIESSLGQIDTLRSKPIDTKTFLRIQDILSDIKQYQNDLNTPIHRVELSFVPSKQIQDFISSSYTMGSVKLDETTCEITIPEILFPLSSTKQSHADAANKLPVATGKRESASHSVSLSQLKGCKWKRYVVKLAGDRRNCNIIGMAITNDGRRLLVDIDNNKVKLFSWDMNLLSSLLLSDYPRDIAVLNNQEAVVITYNKSLVLLDISGRHMSISTTIALSYDVFSISQYGEKFVVSNHNPGPPSVKLIDRTGRVFWSVSTDGLGQSLFKYPMYVTSDVKRKTVTVTDCGNKTLTILHGDTGVVIKRRLLKDKSPAGITTGPSGNLYVCYYDTREIAVLTGDLAEERIILTAQDGLGDGPCVIAHDKICGQLITSYHLSSTSDRNSVDVWDLLS